VLVALVATAAGARERPAELGRMAAAGAVTLASDDQSTAVIHATGLRPGQSVSGTVALANVGDTAGRLTLLRTRLADVPGRFGGPLSRALVLTVQQIGGGAWSGPLAGPDTLDLGVLAAGEGRTYRLTLTFPDTGPLGRDNAFQGSSVTIDWAWATEAIVPPAATPATPATTAAPTPTPAPAPSPAPGPARQPIPRGAPRLDLRIPHQRVLATRGITMFGSCDRACRIAFRATIRTAPKAHASSRALMRQRVFRSRGADRRLPGGGERRIALQLTARAVRTLKQALHARGRVAVVIRARVRGAGGSRTVTRRIVLTRAARTHNPTGGTKAR
jgi:hypothetical protein